MVVTERNYRTVIHWIGHNGTDDRSLEGLFHMLDEHPLNRIFEEYGDYLEPPVYADWSRVMDWATDGSDGEFMFSGNFATYSCTFSLTTNDPDLLARIRAAVEANRARPDFQAQQPRPMSLSLLADYLRDLGVGGPRYSWEPIPDRSCVLLDEVDGDESLVECQLRHEDATVNYVCNRRALKTALIRLARTRRQELGFSIADILGPIEQPEPRTLVAALAGEVSA